MKIKRLEEHLKPGRPYTRLGRQVKGFLVPPREWTKILRWLSDTRTILAAVEEARELRKWGNQFDRIRSLEKRNDFLERKVITLENTVRFLMSERVAGCAVRYRGIGIEE